MKRLPVPGAGFVVLMLALLLTTAFFGWGLRAPPLDRAGRLLLELRMGLREPLSTEELKLLQRALCQHPKLAEPGLLSANRDGAVDIGYAVLVGGGVKVSAPTAGRRRPISVWARARSHEVEGIATKAQPWSWRPPAKTGCPTLIEVHLKKGTSARVEALP